jgi:hypothetical protein
MKCQFFECNTTTSFNLKGCKTGKYCATHREEEMVNVRSKKCEHEGCESAPSFNFKGQKRRLYCSKHRKADMVNLNIKRKAEQQDMQEQVEQEQPPMPPPKRIQSNSDVMLLTRRVEVAEGVIEQLLKQLNQLRGTQCPQAYHIC